MISYKLQPKLRECFFSHREREKEREREREREREKKKSQFNSQKKLFSYYQSMSLSVCSQVETEPSSCLLAYKLPLF